MRVKKTSRISRRRDTTTIEDKKTGRLTDIRTKKRTGNKNATTVGLAARRSNTGGGAKRSMRLISHSRVGKTNPKYGFLGRHLIHQLKKRMKGKTRKIPYILNSILYYIT